MSIKSYYSEPNNNDVSLFGKSFKWVNGDIVIDSKTKNPIMISGIDNLIQTIERSLSIGKGTHLFYSKIGLGIKDIFELQKSVDASDYYDYVGILVQQAIATSTPFYNLIRELKVSRSTQDERKIRISLILEAEETAVGIELETDITKVI